MLLSCKCGAKLQKNIEKNVNKGRKNHRFLG